MVEQKDPGKTRDIRRYFAITFMGPIILLTCWAVIKIGFEHRCSAGVDAGYSGFIAGPAPDIAFVGSSHTHQSYDIAAVEDATGRASYALSYAALDLNDMALLLEELLPNPAHRPKILVLEAYSAKLARRPELDDFRFFFDAPPGLKLKILANLMRVRPGLSTWLDVFDLVVNRGTDQLFTYPLNRKFLARLSYKGAYRGHVMRGVSQGEFNQFHAEIVSSSPDPEQLAALLRIIELCRQNRVRLVLAESPMPKPVSSMPEIQCLKRVFRDEASANHLPYFDGDESFPISDPALFSDAGHLSTAGRELYTSNLIARFSLLFRERDEGASGASLSGSIQPRAFPRN